MRSIEIGGIIGVGGEVGSTTRRYDMIGYG